MDLLADTTVRQVSVYADAHDGTIVKEDFVNAVDSNCISGFIAEQPDRFLQHVRERRQQQPRR